MSTNRIKITVVEFQAAQLEQNLFFWGGLRPCSIYDKILQLPYASHYNPLLT